MLKIYPRLLRNAFSSFDLCLTTSAFHVRELHETLLILNVFLKNLA